MGSEWGNESVNEGYRLVESLAYRKAGVEFAMARYILNITDFKKTKTKTKTKSKTNQRHQTKARTLGYNIKKTN